MVVPTNSKASSTRLMARSLGLIPIRIRSKIDLLNPRKGEEENIERKKKIRKVCNVITVISGDTWPRIIGTKKTRDRKARMNERTLHAKIQMILKVV